MDNKVLPNNPDMEAELLGTIIKYNNKIVDIINLITYKDFYTTKNKHIYSGIIDLYKDNKNIDILTLANKLGTILPEVGGITYLAELVGNSMNENVIDYAEEIKNCSTNRKIIVECRNAIERAYAKELPEKTISLFESRMLEINYEKNDLINSNQLMAKTLDYIQQNYKNGGGLIGMKCGIKLIDNAIDGFIKKEVIVLAGRPSMGKTLLAMQIGTGLSRKNKVAMFELEMSDEALGVRQLSNETKIVGQKLRRGAVNEHEWKEIAEACDSLGHTGLFLDSSSTQTILEIKNKCKKMKLKFGLDCVIIDHIGLLDIPKDQRTTTRTQQIGEITRQAKILAKELDVNVILLSQLSRGVESRPDKRPVMSDLRDSGNIEQDADVVMFVYRDEYYNHDSADKNVIELIIAKQRNGGTGDLRLYCNLATQSIYEDVVGGRK